MPNAGIPPLTGPFPAERDMEYEERNARVVWNAQLHAYVARPSHGVVDPTRRPPGWKWYRAVRWDRVVLLGSIVAILAYVMQRVMR